MDKRYSDTSLVECVLYGTMLFMVFLLFLGRTPTPLRAQSSASVSAVWQTPVKLRVEWRGAPARSCLYLSDVFVPTPCGSAGRVVLDVFGVDVRYQPNPDDVLSVKRDETAGDLARVRVPKHEQILPLVAVP